MKLNVYVGIGELTGYTNIDLTKHALDLGDLNKVCGPSECTEIVLNGVLNYIPHKSLPTVIEHVESRLRHGGKLVILFYNLDSVLKKYNMAELTEEELNQVIYGHGHRSIFSFNYISDLIKNKISTIDIDDGKVTLIVERE